MDEVQTIEWHERLKPFDRWNRRLLLSALGLFGIPGSMLDIGSGTGAMVSLARQMGIHAIGVDLIAEEPDKKYDLTMELDLGETFDLVTCLEVAEHIPPFYTQIFTGNIGRHVRPNGGLLIFSAAPPGQSGDGHVNLRAAHEWRTLLHLWKLNYREDYTIKLRMAWSLIPSPLMWLPANCQVFDRGPIE